MALIGWFVAWRKNSLTEVESFKKDYQDPNISIDSMLSKYKVFQNDYEKIKHAARYYRMKSARVNRHGIKKEDVESLPPKDPQEEVNERMKHLFGEESLKPYQLPRMSASKPHLIPSKSGEILIINSPLIGSLTTEDDKTDIVKNSLRLAEAEKCDAVIITGNLMYMLVQRYGTLRPYKTQVSGVKVDSKKVEDGYPKSVVEDNKFESIEKRRQKGEPIFMTLKLRLEHNTDMLYKTFTDGNGQPLYNGPIYVTFGKFEDELVIFYVNELLRIGLFKSRAWAQKMVIKHTNDWKREKNPLEKEKIYQKVKDFKEWLSVFAIMSNIADESIDRIKEIVTGYIIKKYEERIPNSKVISVGDAFLKVDSRNIMITTDKYKQEFGGKLGAILAAKTESFSKARKDINSIPNVMLGMGLNPFCDIKWVTYQASDEFENKKMCTIIQLPMCIDAGRYREVIRNQNILKDTITRTGQLSGFESGVITMRWHENVSQPIIEFWTSDLLKNREIFKEKKSIQDMINSNKTQHKIMFNHKKGCTHYGANDIKKYNSPNDSDGRLVKYHYQVAMEFMLAVDAPILTDQHDGDITQQANHPYVKNVHPEYLLPEALLEKMIKIENSKLSESEKIKQLKILAFNQKIYDGVLQLDEQVKGYVLSLKPYLNYFLKIIARKKKVNLAFHGRLASIIHIMGNHCKNTYKNSDIFVSDALHITEQLKKLLLGYLIDHNYKGLVKEDIENEVISPQHGSLGEARGSFGVENYQRYALVLKHKQGEIDKTQKRSQKRSVNEHEVGLPIINLSGDNHKGGVRITRGIINIKTGGQQDDGPYGREIDGSEQNVFSLIYGLPVGGLASGPLVFITLDIETMRRYALKPFFLDKKKLFRNALE